MATKIETETLETAKRHLAAAFAYPDFEAVVRTISLVPTDPSVIPHVMETFALIYGNLLVREELIAAAERAKMIYHDGHSKTNNLTKYHQMGADNIQIDKHSILDRKGELERKPPVPLTEMTAEHFADIFYGKGYAPNYYKEETAKFSSHEGFYFAIAAAGKPDSYRRAAELGYDVEFTLHHS